MQPDPPERPAGGVSAKARSFSRGSGLRTGLLKSVGPPFTLAKKGGPSKTRGIRIVGMTAKKQVFGTSHVPLSPAVRAGDMVYVAGQVPVRPDGSLVEGGIESQTRQVLDMF